MANVHLPHIGFTEHVSKGIKYEGTIRCLATDPLAA